MIIKSILTHLKTIDKKALLIAFWGVIVFFGIIYFYMQEIRFFQLYLNPKHLFLVSLCIGLVPAFSLGYLFTYRILPMFDRYRAFAAIFFAVLIVCPLIFSILNRKLSSSPTIHIETQIQQINEIISNPYGHLKGEELKISYYKLTFLWDNATYVVYPTSIPLEKESDLNQALLPVRRGAFGYSWFDDDM